MNGAREAAEAVEREAEKARRQAELEAEAADPIYWRLSNVRCLCVRGYVALARDVLDARRGPHSRRSPCQSRGARQGVPHGGDAEEGGMSGPSPAAEFAEQIFVRRPNSSRDRKLFLRVPSATHPRRRTKRPEPCVGVRRGARANSRTTPPAVLGRRTADRRAHSPIAVPCGSWSWLKLARWCRPRANARPPGHARGAGRAPNRRASRCRSRSLHARGRALAMAWAGVPCGSFGANEQQIGDR